MNQKSTENLSQRTFSHMILPLFKSTPELTFLSMKKNMQVVTHSTQDEMHPWVDFGLVLKTG